ncbi:MAG: hypothetical protein JNK38_23615 [Acidobacteria bacterium]|nr:hypothetical protein [Acidobacteriota bacterium]
MKKQIMNIVATISFLFVMSAISAYAQTPALKANIPFDFQINGKVMKAGEYTISEPVSPKGLVIIRGGQKASSASSLFYTVDENVADQTKLVFRRYGDQYFLTQMTIKGMARNRELPTTKAERELINARFLAGNKAEPKVVIVAIAQ